MNSDHVLCMCFCFQLKILFHLLLDSGHYIYECVNSWSCPVQVSLLHHLTIMTN
jgi:hypothetical protein